MFLYNKFEFISLFNTPPPLRGGEGWGGSGVLLLIPYSMLNCYQRKFKYIFFNLFKTIREDINFSMIVNKDFSQLIEINQQNNNELMFIIIFLIFYIYIFFYFNHYSYFNFEIKFNWFKNTKYNIKFIRFLKSVMLRQYYYF